MDTAKVGESGRTGLSEVSSISEVAADSGKPGDKGQNLRRAGFLELLFFVPEERVPWPH